MNAVQCDYCGKFASNPNARPLFGQRYPRSLPNDWYAVIAAKGGWHEAQTATEEPREFCSKACISKHFAEQERVETAAELVERHS